MRNRSCRFLFPVAPMTAIAWGSPTSAIAERPADPACHVFLEFGMVPEAQTAASH